ARFVSGRFVRQAGAAREGNWEGVTGPSGADCSTRELLWNAVAGARLESAGDRVLREAWSEGHARVAGRADQRGELASVGGVEKGFGVKRFRVKRFRENRFKTRVSTKAFQKQTQNASVFQELVLKRFF